MERLGRLQARSVRCDDLQRAHPDRGRGGHLAALGQQRDRQPHELEAGKLLRTGLTPEQALSTVTNQAAEAIAIHDRVGSLEAGKDGDFVIWSGDPLSQFTRAEQTWIDGRRYFSLEEDAAMREQIAQERTQLIQAILSVQGGGGRSAQTETSR